MSLFTKKERDDLCYMHDNNPGALFDATVAAVLKKLAAGVSVEPASMQFQTRTGAWCDFINDKHRDDTIADGTWPIRSLYTATAIAAARVQENERIAQWYEDLGYLKDEADIKDALRALLGKEQS